MAIPTLRGTFEGWRDLPIAISVLRDPTCVNSSSNAGAALAATEIRRQINQALFERIEVDDDGVTRVQLASPFAQLLANDLLEELAQNVSHPGPTKDQGVKDHLLVELQGLEPWTSSMPWKHSSQLSYSPNGSIVTD